MTEPSYPKVGTYVKFHIVRAQSKGAISSIVVIDILVFYEIIQRAFSHELENNKCGGQISRRITNVAHDTPCFAHGTPQHLILTRMPTCMKLKVFRSYILTT